MKTITKKELLEKAIQSAKKSGYTVIKESENNDEIVSKGDYYVITKTKYEYWLHQKGEDFRKDFRSGYSIPEKDWNRFRRLMSELRYFANDGVTEKVANPIDVIGEYLLGGKEI